MHAELLLYAQQNLTFFFICPVSYLSTTIAKLKNENLSLPPARVSLTRIVTMHVYYPSSSNRDIPANSLLKEVGKYKINIALGENFPPLPPCILELCAHLYPLSRCLREAGTGTPSVGYVSRWISVEGGIYPVIGPFFSCLLKATPIPAAARVASGVVFCVPQHF